MHRYTFSYLAMLICCTGYMQAILQIQVCFTWQGATVFNQLDDIAQDPQIQAINRHFSAKIIAICTTSTQEHPACELTIELPDHTDINQFEAQYRALRIQSNVDGALYDPINSVKLVSLTHTHDSSSAGKYYSFGDDGNALPEQHSSYFSSTAVALGTTGISAIAALGCVLWQLYGKTRDNNTK
jgi:hypothetical protein